MAEAGIGETDILRVDGGMTDNGWVMQRLADILGEAVEVAPIPETTALGAAFYAGQAAGVYGSDEELARSWAPARRYEPKMSDAEREARYSGWLEAVDRVRSRQA
jgi:glycerol kinase